MLVINIILVLKITAINYTLKSIFGRFPKYALNKIFD